MAYNEYWGNVVLALRFDSTPPTEDKGAPVTLNGSAEISSAWADGTGSSLYTDASVPGSAFVPIDVFAGVGTGDFTLCLSFNVPEITGVSQRLFYRGGSGVEVYIGLSSLIVYLPDDNIIRTFGGISANTTHRVMVSRSSGVFRLLLDGVVVDTNTATIDFDSIGSSSGIWISDWKHVGSGVRGGYVDEVFFVSGVALETGNYTPAPLFDAYAGGGGPASVTCDFGGELELSGEVLAAQPYTAELLGNFDLGGTLIASHPTSAVFNGSIPITGVFQADQPAFVTASGKLRLGGALRASVGSSAILDGRLSFGGHSQLGFGSTATIGGSPSFAGGFYAAVARSASVAGEIRISGQLTVDHKQPFVASLHGLIQLSGLLQGDYRLHPPLELANSINVVQKNHRMYVHG